MRRRIGLFIFMLLLAGGIWFLTRPDEPTVDAQNSYTLLARLINGEARGEPFVGQVAVGAVILNRVQHPRFPNTVAGVAYQPGAFEAVSRGQIWAPVRRTSYRAAQAALSGWGNRRCHLFLESIQACEPLDLNGENHHPNRQTRICSLRRNKVRRWTSWIFGGLALVFAVWGITQYMAKERLSTLVENGYQRAFYELTYNIESLETLLAQASASNDPKQQMNYFSDTWRQASAAQANLGQLPLSNLELANTENLSASWKRSASALSAGLAKGRPLTKKPGTACRGFSGRQSTLERA